MGDIIKIRSLGLEAYLKPGTRSHWLLPVCSSRLKERWSRLNPNHPGNWEDTEIDTVPTICYVLTTKQIRAWERTPFWGVWAQFADALGSGPANEFYPALRIKFVNGKARARNKWEECHGGIRKDKFDRGMSIRAAASLSII